MQWENYLEYKVIRGIRSGNKPIKNLKPGDRFIFQDNPLLIFVNVKNENNQLLGISDLGKQVWLDPDTEILHVHAVSSELSLIGHLIKTDVLNNGYLKFKTWVGIKSMITSYLIDNEDRILKNPELRLRALEAVEQLIPKKYITSPKELLTIDKETFKKSIGVSNDAQSSIINNIYDILNGKDLGIKQ